MVPRAGEVGRRTLLLHLPKHIYSLPMIVLLIAFVSIHAFSQEGQIPAFLTGPYTAIGQDYAAISARLAQRGVPPEILEERLREGIAKRVPPDRLKGFLESEGVRLGRIADALRSSGLILDNPASRREQFKTLSMVTTGILSLDTVEAYMAVLTSGLASAESLTSWVTVCVSLYNLSSLTDGDMRVLGEAVLVSKLKKDGYAIIPSLFLKARRNGLSDMQTLKIILRVIKAGGGEFQLEDELRRRKGP